MQDAQNNSTSNEYRNVSISILVESTTNPRNQAGGLDSIRGRGVPQRHNCHRPRTLDR